MSQPSDDRILETLTIGLTLTLVVIAKNIDRKRETVSRRLGTLVDAELVTRVERGYYDITDRSRECLAGAFDPSDLAFDES